MQRFYPQLGWSVIFTLNVSEDNPRRLFIYDHATGKTAHEFDATNDCGGSYDLSPNAQLLASGYWYRKGIDVWDVDSKELVATFGPSRVWSLVFDQTSSRLLVRADSGTRVYSVAAPHEETRVMNAGDLSCGCFILGKNHFVMPSRRRASVISVDLDLLNVVSVDIPIPRTVRFIQHSPTSPTLFAIDTSATVWCFDSSLKRQIWKTKIKRLPARSYVLVGAYSGNGQRIGITVTHLDGFDTIVLDADSGEILDTIDGIACSGYPYAEHCVLDRSGEILNLKTKELSQGISAITDY